MVVVRALSLVLVVAGLGVPVATAGDGSSARAPGRISIAPARPISGENAAVTGSVPGGKRSVVLQRAAGSLWRTAARGQSTAVGAFRFAVKTPAGTSRYRVVAPAVRARRLKAFTSAVLTVRPVGQGLSFASPQTATVGTPFTVRATASPARAGRTVQVQRRNGASWTPVGSAKQTSAGIATVQVTPTTVGTATYRVVSLAFRGAAAIASGSIDVNVKEAPPFLGTTRVSVSSAGAQGDQLSSAPDISGDGRYVVFDSLAGTLVPGDTNGKLDVFRHDRQTGTTVRVTPGGANQVTQQAVSPTISADGRYVAFLTNDPLVGTDTNGGRDVYVWDATTGGYTLVTRKPDGTAGGGVDNAEISADGRFVVFGSTSEVFTAGLDPATLNLNVYRWNRETGAIDWISRATDGTDPAGGSGNPSVSADGSVVAYESGAADVVTGDDNNRTDVFAWRASSGLSTLISATSDGTVGNLGSGNPSVSGDGTRVAFDSDASDLLAGDTNGVRDVFWRSLTPPNVAPTTGLVSTGPTGGFVVGGGAGPAISNDDKVIAFTSASSVLVSGDTNGEVDVFLRRRISGPTTLASVTSSGGQANDGSGSPALSADGTKVAFGSGATNLVTGDTNGVSDVFARG